MENKLRNLNESLSKFRAWVDNETVSRTPGGKSCNDDFAERIEQEIESLIEKQMFHYDKDKVITPTRFTIHLNEEDNAEWYGIKRDLLQQRLNKFVENNLKQFSMDFYNEHFVQIQPSWEIKKRGEIKVTHHWQENNLPEIRFNTGSQKVTKNSYEDSSEDTIICSPPRRNDLAYSDVEYETAIKANLKSLFSLEIWRSGVYQCVLPIVKPTVVLGRASPLFDVDISLTGDLEISRRHAILQMESKGIFNLQVMGRNPVIVREIDIFQGQTISCVFGEQIKVGSYLITIQDSPF